MTLDQYSTLLAVGSMGLLLYLLVIGVLALVSQEIRNKIKDRKYFHYIYVLAGIALTATAGSLIYQLVYETPVCELCWWQRIFIYPIVVITLVSLWKNAKEAHLMTGVLALFGIFFASYHYYYHFKGFVLGEKLTLPCTYGGLLPACTDSPILIFGFVTIPFLALMVFGSVLIVSLFAHLALKKN